MVHLSVTQKKSWRWEAKPEAEPRTSAMPGFSNTTHLLPEENTREENMPEEMELPISADGEVHLSIPIWERTESLTVDVRCCPVVLLVQSRSWSSPGAGPAVLPVEYWAWSGIVDGPVRFFSAEVSAIIGLMVLNVQEELK